MISDFGFRISETLQPGCRRAALALTPYASEADHRRRSIPNPKPKIRKRRAFTLIELMVVLVILSILAAVIIPRVMGRGEDARRAKAVSDVESIGTALDMYAADNGRYPTSEQGLEALREPPTQAPLPRAWNGPYLKKTLAPDPWGQLYQYQSPGVHNPATYDLWSLGADGQPGGGGNNADITSWE